MGAIYNPWYRQIVKYFYLSNINFDGTILKGLFLSVQKTYFRSTEFKTPHPLRLINDFGNVFLKAHLLQSASCTRWSH